MYGSPWTLCQSISLHFYIVSQLSICHFSLTYRKGSLRSHTIYVLRCIPLSYPTYGFPDSFQINYQWYIYIYIYIYINVLRAHHSLECINYITSTTEIIKNGPNVSYLGHRYIKVPTRKNNIFVRLRLYIRHMMLFIFNISNMQWYINERMQFSLAVVRENLVYFFRSQYLYSRVGRMKYNYLLMTSRCSDN